MTETDSASPENDSYDSAAPPASASGVMRRLGQRLLATLRGLFILWFVALVMLASLQRQLMYFPDTAAALPVQDNQVVMRRFPGSTDVEIDSSGTQPIRGWWLRRESGTQLTRPLVILFHGNAGNRAGRQGWYDLIGEIGCDILAIDYQGYGDSPGAPTQAALEADAEATWQFAVNTLNYQPGSIYVMGVSLGGAAAVHVAALQTGKETPAGLITVATFSSMLEVASSKYRWFPVRAVLLDTWFSAKKIADLEAPFLHLHGDVDGVVETRFGKNLFAAAPEQSVAGIPRRWVTLKGTGHNDILLRSRRLVLDELHTFVNALTPTTTIRTSQQ